MVKEKKDVSKQENILESPKNQLILYNDDYHTFEFVMESLIKICGHDPIIAEQCTMIAHYKGKCNVKSASNKDLLPLRNELANCGLIAAIE